MAEAQAVSEEKFSKYPEAMENYFNTHNIEINIFPKKYEIVKEHEFCTLKITSAQQLFDFIEQELKFWDSSSKYSILNCFSKLNNAVVQLNNAINYFSSGNYRDGEDFLARTLSCFSSDYLSSKTKLAKFLNGYTDKGSNFEFGFDLALQGKDNSNFNYTVKSGNLEGFIAGLSYRGEFKQISALIGKSAKNFAINIIEAENNYADLNRRYTESFIAQEHRIEEIKEKTDAEIDNLKNQTKEFFDQKQLRSEELENLYENKLRLEKPALYWKEMASSYSKQSKKWLAASCITAIAIVAMLVLIIVLVPNLFKEDAHWFDIFKNSAIITVIASIAIYMLRMFVKMTMSSLHLSRDAKEREQLSYFYLALIESKAVSDKEKALVINALFSRSDTGLLKGDSTPVMSANIGEVLDKLNKDK